MTYDLIVLGGGPAGYLASERAGHAGLSVLCVEERNVGGVCLNEGCIPTKTLLYSAKIFDGAAHGDKYGVTAEGLKIDHAKVVDRKDKVVKTLVAGVSSALKANHVTLVNARGVITGRTEEGYTVSAGGETYVGTRLLIATGSSPAVPPIPGLKEGLAAGFVCTNREILALTEKPEHLCVIGGGVIGLELASYFTSIGSKVTVIEMLDHIAGENDAELVAPPPEAGEPQDWTVPTPQSCPALYVVTLPLLFQAAVKPGLGAAALDHQSGGQVQDLVCHLVESGVWDHTETVSRLETARLLPDRANAFQQRWLKQLEQRLAALA